ncbi:flavin reductase family protein [Clostridium fallax]|uniref:NADH-FMN oxidoreductase RutF, flavin reductase (DIM6/NTAB) family n=1 Tax=Clostridium fallax TaxID=1533 RepID=A0A1M4WVF1_9CLOT|nr:NADH-FMN oxidoreductase RutF, flavin reductase (DIM6/NTAB) family [Clostridium fallax]
MKKEKFKGSAILNPVPAVLVTCKNNEGKVNVLTIGWCSTICTKPPMIGISIRPERLSYEYIKETMEFTVNLPSKNLTKAVDFCGVRSGRDLDKIKEMNFSLGSDESFTTPFIKECPVNIQCKVKQIIPLGTHDLFIGEVTNSLVNSDLLDDKGKIHFEWANLIAYCHGEYYPLPSESIGKFGFSVAKKTSKAKSTKSFTIKNNKPKNKKSTIKNNRPKLNTKTNNKKSTKPNKKKFK